MSRLAPKMNPRNPSNCINANPPRLRSAINPSPNSKIDIETQSQITQSDRLLAALLFSLSALALAADSVQINDPVVASTISKMERGATREAAHAFCEFWRTGDEAPLKKALVENFADGVVGPPRAPATIGLRPSRRLGASEKE